MEVNSAQVVWSYDITTSSLSKIAGFQQKTRHSRNSLTCAQYLDADILLAVVPKWKLLITIGHDTPNFSMSSALTGCLVFSWNGFFLSWFVTDQWGKNVPMAGSVLVQIGTTFYTEISRLAGLFGATWTFSLRKCCQLHRQLRTLKDAKFGSTVSFIPHISKVYYIPFVAFILSFHLPRKSTRTSL